MPQRRIWKDPNQPTLADLPLDRQKQLLRHLAKMALDALRARTSARKRRSRDDE